VLALTLDTWCVIEAQSGPQAHLVERLIEFAREGRVGLWLTEAFRRDQERDTDERRRADTLAWFEQAPILGMVPAPFRLDYSDWDGPDVIVTDEQGALDDEIRRIVLPSSLRPGAIAEDTTFTEAQVRRHHDVQHLMAHAMAGHDAFVTGDRRHILSKQGALADLGVIVWSVGEAVDAVERSPGF
jgi:hypothetical protein